MSIKILKLLITFFYPVTVFGQNLPKDLDTLHQTQVMFQLNELKNCNSYKMSLFNSKKELIFQKKTTSLAILCSNIMQFNNTYTWNYEGYINSKKLFTSKNFSIFTKGFTKEDSLLYKYKITQQDFEHPENSIIFLDGNGTAINKAGKVVWQLNNFNKTESRFMGFRNINLTPQGAITYLESNNFISENLNGAQIFKATNKNVFSNDSTEHYHHDGFKLKNGNFLIGSYRFEKDKGNNLLQYGSIVELNQKNKLVWSWNEKNYISNENFLKNKQVGETSFSGNHLNGFDFNENTNDLIVSFRDNNRLVKTNKKKNTFLYELVNKQIEGVNFEGQHSPMFALDNSNSFYFYNNNLQRNKRKENNKEESAMNATIIEMKEIIKDSVLQKNWEYEIFSDSFPNGTTGKEGFVQPLNNKNLLVCQGGGNRIFELTKEKKIVWECFTYNYSVNNKKWEAFSNYRCRYYSSLYPRYFTIQTKFSIKKNQIKVNNDGTDDDEYEVINKDNNKVIKTVKIKASDSLIISLKSTEKNLIIKPKGVEGISKTIEL